MNNNMTKEEIIQKQYSVALDCVSTINDEIKKLNGEKHYDIISILRKTGKEDCIEKIENCVKYLELFLKKEEIINSNIDTSIFVSVINETKIKLESEKQN